MANKMPEVLKGFALIVEARGYGGRSSELVLPKLEREMEDYRAGGMDRPLKIDMGGKPLSCEYTLDEYNADILKTWGLTTVDGLSLRFKGSVKADDVDGDEIPVQVVMRGRYSEIDKGKWESGKEQKMKLKAELTYYEYIYNGETLIKIDVQDVVEEVGGVDRLASRRTNLAT